MARTNNIPTREEAKIRRQHGARLRQLEYDMLPAEEKKRRNPKKVSD